MAAGTRPHQARGSRRGCCPPPVGRHPGTRRGNPRRGTLAGRRCPQPPSSPGPPSAPSTWAGAAPRRRWRRGGAAIDCSALGHAAHAQSPDPGSAGPGSGRRAPRAGHAARSPQVLQRRHLPDPRSRGCFPAAEPTPPPAPLRQPVRRQQCFIGGWEGRRGRRPRWAVRVAGRRAGSLGPGCRRGPAVRTAAGPGRPGPRRRAARCTVVAPAAARRSCPRGGGRGDRGQYSLQGGGGAGLRELLPAKLGGPRGPRPRALSSPHTLPRDQLPRGRSTQGPRCGPL